MSNKKIVVFSDTGPKPKDPTRLRLTELHGEVRLVAVNEVGVPLPSGIIFTLQEDGSLRMHHSVSQELGFKLDEYGCVVTHS